MANSLSPEALTIIQKLQQGELTVVEGVYSLHPYFGKYYDLAIFLDIAPDIQKKRIGVRNSPMLARRFFDEWIPMENAYFEATRIQEKVDLVVNLTHTTDQRNILSPIHT